MTSWQRFKAYAYQNGQNPYSHVRLTSKQFRRYTRKWKREMGDGMWQKYLAGDYD